MQKQVDSGTELDPLDPSARNNSTRVDAIVIGARVAGSPTAMLLARKGYRVLLLDKTTFPSDTMSTHAIAPVGIARLKRWGVLDRVIRSNCPPVPHWLIDVGPFVLDCFPPPVDGITDSYIPRRKVVKRQLNRPITKKSDPACYGRQKEEVICILTGIGEG